jgi:hypothetical protein
MIQHPAILSLLVSSTITSLMMLFAGWKGVQIIRHWDLRSGSERQLQLERATYLISTILGYILLFQTISLFLYIFTTDYLHTLFVGAMCAAGSLNANGFGYPVLILKIVTCLCAGVWLIINHVDSKGYDYPLIRTKYGLLLALVPCVAAETILQFLYFGSLKAQVITSCCGSLFSSGAGTITSELAGLPRVPMEVALSGAIVITSLVGIQFRKTGKGGYLFAVASTLTFFIAAAALISVISLYVYELPTHHCPFCILHKDYAYVGYPLYAALLGAGISGLGVGTLMPARETVSLSKIVPSIQRKLAAFSVVLYLLFGVIAVYLVTTSALKF